MRADKNCRLARIRSVSFPTSTYRGVSAARFFAKQLAVLDYVASRVLQVEVNSPGLLRRVLRIFQNGLVGAHQSVFNLQHDEWQASGWGQRAWRFGFHEQTSGHNCAANSCGASPPVSVCTARTRDCEASASPVSRSAAPQVESQLLCSRLRQEKKKTAGGRVIRIRNELPRPLTFQRGPLPFGPTDGSTTPSRRSTAPVQKDRCPETD